MEEKQRVKCSDCIFFNGVCCEIYDDEETFSTRNPNREHNCNDFDDGEKIDDNNHAFQFIKTLDDFEDKSRKCNPIRIGKKNK